MLACDEHRQTQSPMQNQHVAAMTICVSNGSRLMAQTTWTHARVCLFGGFVDTAPYFGGEIPRRPETPNFWALIGVYKPNGQNIESFMLSKLLIDFNEILHNDRDHQELVVGGPNRRPTNPRWRTAAILKKT